MGSTGKTTRSKPAGIKNYVSWFEIPALNFEQAVKFYSTIYNIEMEQSSSNDYAMAFFPTTSGIGGAVVAGAGSVPGENGPLVYLNGGKDLTIVLDRIADAGGRVIMPKTFISDEHGYFAIFIDSEGNKLALHSKN